MKAAVYEKYGPPDVLRVREVDKPVPADKELLVRVYAATVNRTDCGYLSGKPVIIRLFSGLTVPRKKITGTDFAGTVESAGKSVTSFKPGDRVFGFDDTGLESHAEFLTIPVDKPVSMIPGGMSFEQAAASLEGAHYAYNFIKKMNLEAGHNVLVNGATGAIGSAALQFVKYFGASATAVCNTKNIELVKSLGADRVIDYETHDFTRDGETYDFVLDAVGKSTFKKCLPVLKPHGVYISSELGPGCQNPVLVLITAMSRGKKVKFPLPADIKSSILFITLLIEKGKFVPVIDRICQLEQIADVFEYVASGRKTGNVILSMETA